MNGDPIDPIRYERAERELWHGMAASAGLDLKQYLLGSSDEQSAETPELDADGSQREEHFERLEEEARTRLLSLIMVGEIRAWTADGDNWRRLTDQGLVDRFARDSDEPTGLYVDRQELARAAAARWSIELGCSRAPASPPGKQRGRPRGSGTYAKDDAPLLAEMRALIEAGQAKSPNDAAQQVAPRAKGASPDSIVKRLRDAYKRRWGN